MKRIAIWGLPPWELACKWRGHLYGGKGSWRDVLKVHCFSWAESLPGKKKRFLLEKILQPFWSPDSLRFVFCVFVFYISPFWSESLRKQWWSKCEIFVCQWLRISMPGRPFPLYNFTSEGKCGLQTYWGSIWVTRSSRTVNTFCLKFTHFQDNRQWRSSEVSSSKVWWPTPTGLFWVFWENCLIRSHLLQFWTVFTLRSPDDVQVQ